MSDRPAVAHSVDARPTSDAPSGTGADATAGTGIDDTPAEAAGRRILSTAFVRVGPDGLMTVDLRNGGERVLKDIELGARKFCGADVKLGGVRTCFGYAEVTAARPNGS